MRLSVTSLLRMVKRPLRVEFVHQELTSYSGLELLRRYLRQLDLPRRLRAACVGLGGDYGGARLGLLVLALFYVGARRLEHLHYLAGDPLLARFCGLARIPTARTVANWLRQFTTATLAPLVQLNRDLVLDAIARLQLPAADHRHRRHRRPHPRDGRLGLSRVQPASRSSRRISPGARTRCSCYRRSVGFRTRLGGHFRNLGMCR